MTGKIVYENLKHRPMRSLLSVLLIGVPVTLMLCLVGLSHGFLEDTQKRNNGTGADILVRPKGSSYFSLNGAPMREEFVALIAKQPHVKLATGVYNQTVEGVTLSAAGVDYDAFSRMSGGFIFLAGGGFQGPDDVILDDFYASQTKAKVGGTIELWKSNWRVAGIIESGKLAHIVVPLKSLQKRNDNADHISQVLVQLDDPKQVKPVIAQLQELLGEGVPIISVADFVSLMNVNNVPALAGFILVVTGIGVVIGFLVVSLSMYMAVLQRTREIGILKSLGASKSFILGIILTEALFLGIGGTLLGIGFTYGAAALIHILKPATLPMIMVYEWWPIAGGITILGALLGALYPGFTAASHDPIEALSYE